MGRPKKPIQRRSNGVYCVQLHLGGRRVMRSLQTRDIEVAHLRAGQAMAELEAAHKAQQQGATRWRDAREFVNLLELADAVDIQTAAENYTGKCEQDEVTGDYLDPNTQALAFVRWRESAGERTCPPSLPVGTGTWALPSSSVLSNCLRPLQKPSGSGSIKCLSLIHI